MSTIATTTGELAEVATAEEFSEVQPRQAQHARDDGMVAADISDI